MEIAPDLQPVLNVKSGNSKIIIANWKANLPNLEDWAQFPKYNSEVVICPPSSGLSETRRVIPNVEVGAQDIGDLSDAVQYVIIGHSDRRKAGDNDDVVSHKLRESLSGGMTAILCIGENRDAKSEGRSEDFVGLQVEKALADIPSSDFNRIIVAYEPVWAISTEESAEVATPLYAAKMIRFIKGLNSSLMYSRFIYGGSVNPDNAAAFLSDPDIEGVLVGAASLDVEKFKRIAQIADSV